MEIILYHKHYNQKHLDEVKAEMIRRGAPVIRAIWNDGYGMWLAVEGCHRIRAAKELGMMPVIKDISNNKTATIQIDGSSERVNVVQLAEELVDQVYSAIIINFEE